MRHISRVFEWWPFSFLPPCCSYKPARTEWPWNLISFSGGYFTGLCSCMLIFRLQTSSQHSLINDVILLLHYHTIGLYKDHSDRLLRKMWHSNWREGSFTTTISSRVTGCVEVILRSPFKRARVHSRLFTTACWFRELHSKHHRVRCEELQKCLESL